MNEIQAGYIADDQKYAKQCENYAKIMKTKG